jgi:hypothetical protein
MILPLLLVAAQAEVPPPRTVNDQVIGKAEDFRTPGPARICINATSVDIEAGEAAYLQYLGIHFGTVRVVGPRGSFTVQDGDSWRAREDGEMLTWDGRNVQRRRPGGRPSYIIHDRPDYPADREVPRVLVSGDALGRGVDRKIIARIRTHPAPPDRCAIRYVYGWETLLGPADPES